MLVSCGLAGKGRVTSLSEVIHSLERIAGEVSSLR